MKRTCVNLVIVTTFIRPEIVRKVSVSVNVRPLMLPQIVTDVVRDITDIRIASLVNASWMEQEEDNVKIQAGNVPANKISVENFVINVPMAFITSRNANLASATKLGQGIRYVTKRLVSVCVIAVTEIFHVINVTTVIMDFPRALIAIVI